MSIYGEYVDNDAKTDININISENKEVRAIHFADLEYIGTIQDETFSFDETSLLYVEITSCLFSDSALQNLITALTSKKYVLANRQISITSVSNLPNDQKAALTTAGWEVI